MGISYRGFFLHRYRANDCAHDLLLRVNFPAYSNADRGAEDAAWAFGESAAEHLRTWWERWVLPRACDAEHERISLGEATDEEMDEDGPLLGPGLREIEVWVSPVGDGGRYVRLSSTGVTRHVVYLLTDEDGREDLSEPGSRRRPRDPLP
jgi:hypothetical protein